jgi:hypothetical protein
LALPAGKKSPRVVRRLDAIWCEKDWLVGASSILSLDLHYFAGVPERELKRSNTFALALSVSLAGPISAYAAEESATPVRHYRQHVHQHHTTARKALPAASTGQGAPTLVKPSTRLRSRTIATG